MSDDSHWLWRLSADAWLEAARRELDQAQAKLGSRRTSVTHARRAAGMALNGVLVSMAGRGWSRERCETVWGRSYIDHLRALANPTEPGDPDPTAMFDSSQFERCRVLLGVPVMPPSGLVPLAAQKHEAANTAFSAAGEITRACASIIGS